MFARLLLGNSLAAQTRANGCGGKTQPTKFHEATLVSLFHTTLREQYQRRQASLWRSVGPRSSNVYARAFRSRRSFDEDEHIVPAAAKIRPLRTLGTDSAVVRHPAYCRLHPKRVPCYRSANSNLAMASLRYIGRVLNRCSLFVITASGGLKC